ncbi:hypothetical protein E4U41_007471 [Claviceps citrina]|nr:hypothetical protein E4U41_007471 [Claviceps citrina]
MQTQVKPRVPPRFPPALTPIPDRSCPAKIKASSSRSFDRWTQTQRDFDMAGEDTYPVEIGQLWKARKATEATEATELAEENVSRDYFDLISEGERLQREPAGSRIETWALIVLWVKTYDSDQDSWTALSKLVAD